MILEDKKTLISIIGGSILTYTVASRLWEYFRSCSAEWVPVGTVQQLFVYPVKSCKGISVFSFFCDDLGPVQGENYDRHFTVIDAKSGSFYSGREKPQMVTFKCEVKEGILTVELRDGSTLHVDIEKVRKDNVIRSGKFQFDLRADGLDCGNEAAEFFSKALDEQGSHLILNDLRLIMYDRKLYTERICVTKEDWWNNNVPPKRKDNSGFANLTPYMITTQASLDELNSKLEKSVTSAHFRPVIVVDKCPAWDEDKWSDLRIGNVHLQCYKACNRCLLITVDPETGIKDSNTQPLRKLREFRLAPEGRMRNFFKDSPIFGVNAGVIRRGYIYVGQTVYARYKKMPF